MITLDDAVVRTNVVANALGILNDISSRSLWGALQCSKKHRRVHVLHSGKTLLKCLWMCEDVELIARKLSVS